MRRWLMLMELDILELRGCGNLAMRKIAHGYCLAFGMLNMCGGFRLV